MTWVTILLAIAGLIGIPIVTIIALNFNKAIKKVDVNPNMPIIINWTRQQFSDGHFLGTLKRMRPNKNKTYLVEFYAWDVEQTEISPKPEVQSFVLDKECMKEFFSLSARRVIIMAIGRNKSDYPKEMRDTLEGDYLSKEGQLAHLTSTFGKMIPLGDEALKEAMNMYARGDITKATIEIMKKQIEDLKKMKNLSPEEKPKS